MNKDKNLMMRTTVFTSQKENIERPQSTNKSIIKKAHKYIQKKATITSKDNKPTKECEIKGIVDIANDFLNSSVINKFTAESLPSGCESVSESEEGKEQEEMTLNEIGSLKTGASRSRQERVDPFGKPTERRTADSANEMFKYRLMLSKD